jgi:hypothetical protein
MTGLVRSCRAAGRGELKAHERVLMPHLHLRARHRAGSTASGNVKVRIAGPQDSDALAYLAALDSKHPPSGPTLIAEVDGELRAALSVPDQTVIADPFQSSAGLVELLRARSAELSN